MREQERKRLEKLKEIIKCVCVYCEKFKRMHARTRTFTQTPSNSLRMSVNYEHNTTFQCYCCYLYVSCAYVCVCVCDRSFLLQLKSTLAFFCGSCCPLVLFVSVHYLLLFYLIWWLFFFHRIGVLLWPLYGSISMWPLSPQAKYQMELAYTHIHAHTSMGAKPFY